MVLFRLFACCSAATVVPFALAIFQSESPRLTVYTAAAGAGIELLSNVAADGTGADAGAEANATSVDLAGMVRTWPICSRLFSPIWFARASSATVIPSLREIFQSESPRFTV